jgi:hypothetical protein
MDRRIHRKRPAALREVPRLALAGSTAGADRDRVRHHAFEKIRFSSVLIGAYNLCVPAIDVERAPLELKEKLWHALAGTP